MDSPDRTSDMPEELRRAIAELQARFPDLPPEDIARALEHLADHLGFSERGPPPKDPPDGVRDRL